MTLALVELPSEVLQELRVIGGDEAPSATDAAFIQRQYQFWLSEAIRDWDVTWDEDDDIPSGAEKAVILLLANYVAPNFAKAFSPERQAIGEGKLIKAVRRLPSLEPPRNDHF